MANKGARLAMVALSLLVVMAALQAFGAKSAEALGIVPRPPECPYLWIGTDANDTKWGTDCAETMDGLGGDDFLAGEGGPTPCTAEMVPMLWRAAKKGATPSTGRRKRQYLCHVFRTS